MTTPAIPITGPKPFGVDITDPLAFLMQEFAKATEAVVKLVGPGAAAAVTVLNDAVSLLWIVALLRDPLNGKNATRIDEAKAWYAAGDLTNLITRYNATPLEPDWFRCVLQLLIVLLGVPLSAFPS